MNVAVGRSDKTLRLFVTCTTTSGKTILKMFDRNMNNELTSTAQQVSNLGEDVKIVDAMISTNHIIYKQTPTIRSMAFIEVGQ